MPDVPYPPDPEPSRLDEFAQKLVALRDRLDEGTRTAMTGEPSGRIRRPVLFALVAIGLLAGGTWPPAAAIGAVALIWLALTDAVVPL